MLDIDKTAILISTLLEMISRYIQFNLQFTGKQNLVSPFFGEYHMELQFFGVSELMSFWTNCILAYRFAALSKLYDGSLSFSPLDIILEIVQQNYISDERHTTT